jgi:hypothetical protein
LFKNGRGRLKIREDGRAREAREGKIRKGKLLTSAARA